jgi:hypothetical protein
MGKGKSIIAGQSKKTNIVSGQSVAEVAKQPQTFCVSLKNFDTSQGQRFSDWEEAQLLAKLLDRWHSHSAKPLEQCLDKRFKRYPSFPAKSEFRKPKSIPPDAMWASMHVQGEECVAGHIIGNVFYVVFLDRHHKFWPTEKKHT